jgi:hypothetical protein
MGLDPRSNLPAGELAGAPGIAQTCARALWNENVAGNLEVAAPLGKGHRSNDSDGDWRRRMQEHGAGTLQSESERGKVSRRMSSSPGARRRVGGS